MTGSGPTAGRQAALQAILEHTQAMLRACSADPLSPDELVEATAARQVLVEALAQDGDPMTPAERDCLETIAALTARIIAACSAEQDAVARQIVGLRRSPPTPSRPPRHFSEQV